MMRQVQAVAAATVLLLITAAALGGLNLRPAHAGPLRQAPGASPCSVAADKVASPSVIGLGEVASVNFTMRFTCPDAGKIHLVMVLDASGSMAGDPTRKMKFAMTTLVDRFDLLSHPEVQVGVVEFTGSARTLCQLTNSPTQAKGCISRIGANGSSCIDCGIREGLRVILNGRRRTPGPAPDFAEVMLVVSDGANDTACPPVLTAARQAKAQGILMITVCVSSACDAQCMREAASSARYVYAIDSADALLIVVDRLIAQFAGPSIVFQHITLVDDLAANMPLVPGSAVPAPSQVMGNQVSWDWRLIPAGFVSATLQIRPQALGTWPTDVQAAGEFRDHLGRSGIFTFTVPSITIGQPTSTATPIPLPATITPTSGPTFPPVSPTRTPTAPPAPQATATPVSPQVCQGLAAQVPAAVINQAQSNPASVNGWGLRCNPSQPPAPWNGLRSWLTLHNSGAVYHPLYNGLVWKCGCR